MTPQAGDAGETSAGQGGSAGVGAVAGEENGGAAGAAHAGESMGGITPVAGSEAGGSGAGEGGVAGASMHPANCDDGDPCTIDEAVAAGCDHRAVEDDTACDDGDVCTARDACQSGKCVGTFEETEGKLLGQLHAFGGFAPEHDGLALVLPGERAVFADPLNRGATRLTLVSTQGDALTVLDQIESPWPVVRT